MRSPLLAEGDVLPFSVTVKVGKAIGEFSPSQLVSSPEVHSDSMRNGAPESAYGGGRLSLLVASLTLPLQAEVRPQALHAHTQAAQPSLPGPEAEPHILQGTSSQIPLLPSPPGLTQWLCKGPDHLYVVYLSLVTPCTM